MTLALISRSGPLARPVRDVWTSHRAVASRLFAVVLIVQAAMQPIRGLRDLHETDLVAFLTGARLLGGGCLYCFADQHVAQHAILGFPFNGVPLPFISLPLVAVLVWPLAQVSLAMAFVIFSVVSVAAMFGAGVLFARLTGSPLAAVLVIASLPAAYGLALGQWDPIMLLPLVGAAALLCERPGGALVGGQLASVGLLKPQLIVLLPVALVCARQWRMVAGFAFGSSVWLVTSLLLAGHSLSHLPSLIRGAGLVEQAHPLPVTVALMLASVIALVLRREALRRDALLALTAGVGLSLLSSPHAFGEDWLLLALPLLQVCRYWQRAGITAAVALNAAWVVDQATGATLAETAVAFCIVGMAFLAAQQGTGRDIAGQAPPVNAPAGRGGCSRPPGAG